MITLRDACKKAPPLGMLYSYPAPGVIERSAAGVFTSIPRITKAVQMGYSLMCAAGDVGLLASASANTAGQFRNHLKEINSGQNPSGDSASKDSSVY